MHSMSLAFLQMVANYHFTVRFYIIKSPPSLSIINNIPFPSTNLKNYTSKVTLLNAYDLVFSIVLEEATLEGFFKLL